MIIGLSIMLVVITMVLLLVLYCYNKLWDSIYELNKTIKSKDRINSIFLKVQDNPTRLSVEEMAVNLKDYIDKQNKII